MNQKRIEKAIHHCYEELFKASTPSVDFNKLLREAEVNDRGQKIIKFMDYEISMEESDKIIEDTIKLYRIPKHLQTGFKFTINLGASPKFSK